jgi:hypothetical protein
MEKDEFLGKDVFAHINYGPLRLYDLAQFPMMD